MYAIPQWGVGWINHTMRMAQNPRNYPDIIPSAQSGRPMTRGEKSVRFKIDGRAFTYMRPGWWCSLVLPE